MIGAAVTVVLVAVIAALALRPPMPTGSSPFNLRFALAWLVCEVPLVGLVVLVGGTWSTLVRPEVSEVLWWVVAGGVALDLALLGALAARMRTTRPALAAAFVEVFGPRAAPPATRPPWVRIVALPLVARRGGVRRLRNLRYGPARRGHRLDVYAPRHTGRGGAPVLVYLHPGGFVMGSKRLGGRPLLERFATRGWVTASADYRLRGVDHGDQLADARAAIDWVRRHAAEWGGNPDEVFVAGGSAGAHLAATAALTGAPVRGVVGLYGFYGTVQGPGGNPQGPSEVMGSDAPPFLIVNGSVDTLVVPRDTRAFAEALAAVSDQPVVHAELPGAHHNFDFFDSLRLHRVGDAIEHFVDLVLDRSEPEGPATEKGVASPDGGGS